MPIETGSNVMKLSSTKSGYSANEANWKEFLSCWHQKEVGRAANSGGSLFALIDKDVEKVTAFAEDLARQKQAIIALEARLEIKLPGSYIDFVMAYLPSLSLPLKDGDVGFISTDHVARLAEVDPEYVALAENHFLNSSDDDYYQYGTNQDDSAGRTSYLRDALVVGKYGESNFELILLYPKSVTLDGEMEASLLLHSGEFRAPSFAELMRQLSYMQTNDVDSVPPYSQARLVSSCAQKLPLVGVWWE
jgi:hypothetical protein